MVSHRVVAVAKQNEHGKLIAAAAKAALCYLGFAAKAIAMLVFRRALLVHFHRVSAKRLVEGDVH
jgi:hypothetical protein